MLRNTSTSVKYGLKSTQHGTGSTKHLEIPQIPMAVLAIDTIGHLLVTSKGNRWALTAICLHTSYMFAIPVKKKTAKNVV